MTQKIYKVLFVEDDLNNHPLYRDAFARQGFAVTFVENAEDDFVSQVLAYNPDVISMDLMIGSEFRTITRDGFDAIALLKADPRTRQIPIFIMSNFIEEEKIYLAHELGVVDFINLQGQTINKLPDVFRRYLDHPKKYQAVHPSFRTNQL